MRSSFTGLFGAALVWSLLSTPQAMADETGLASIHSWQKVSGRTCLVDHEHDGSGKGDTQPLAMRSAIQSWESFTDLEYGSDWASYANSVGKRVSCGRLGGEVSCQIAARACRGGALAPTQRRASRTTVRR